MRQKTPVIISACLLGLNTRHDAGSALSFEVVRLLEGRAFIPVCPEQLGGLPTPRPRAELICGSGAGVLKGDCRVMDERGLDVTENFVRGAQEVLRIARLSGAVEAFLKEKSPSCGPTTVVRDGKTVAGEGVTAALLKMEGVAVKGF
ncbi:MAG: DUF523 domain-containing protein [Deltaproteobacteria bacterium]|nr:DUF523 domain-containing protein [Deltaproteobacteria bacterium]